LWAFQHLLNNILKIPQPSGSERLFSVPRRAAVFHVSHVSRFSGAGRFLFAGVSGGRSGTFE